MIKLSQAHKTVTAVAKITRISSVTLRFHFQLTTQGSNGSVLSNDICAANERVRGSISGEEGSSAIIELWYKRTDVFYRATCYFWDDIQ